MLSAHEPRWGEAQSFIKSSLGFRCCELLLGELSGACNQSCLFRQAVEVLENFNELSDGRR
jgi:hypothetical protein